MLYFKCIRLLGYLGSGFVDILIKFVILTKGLDPFFRGNSVKFSADFLQIKNFKNQTFRWVFDLLWAMIL